MKLHDYYEILGVGRAARSDAIKQAYRVQVLRWHPDRHSGAAKDRAEVRFKEISEAYEVLSDPRRRREHDDGAGRSGGFDRSTGRPQGDGVGVGEDGPEFEGKFGEGFADAFSTMYGGFEKGFAEVNGRGGFRSRGRDIEAECSLTVGQVMAGGAVAFEVAVGAECGACIGEGFVEDADRNETICNDCEGNGSVTEMKPLKIDVPADAHEGMEIQLDGQGAAGKFGGASGDLCVTLRIGSDDRYRVVGRDVHADLPVAPWEALDGLKVEVNAPTGVLCVSVPAEAKNGARLRVPGNGLLQEDGSRGDLYLAVCYDLPRELTERQRHLVRELGRAGEGVVRGGARAEG